MLEASRAGGGHTSVGHTSVEVSLGDSASGHNVGARIGSRGRSGGDVSGGHDSVET